MIGIIDFGSTKVPDILRCVEELKYSCEVVRYSSKFQVGNSKWDKVILSGAPILLSQIKDTEGYISFANEIIRLNIPVLGICFGHQIIGMAHGTQCLMGKEDRAGQIINVVKDDPIFNGLESSFEMQQDHCEYVELPEKFIHLGQSEFTENEVMKHVSEPIYGCQFHPEVSGANGLKFIENFLKVS